MGHPNFEEEKKLWAHGFKCVVGLDEAGRGPLAGPVVAGAVLLSPKIKNQKFKFLYKIDDSKKLSEKQRDYFFKIITKHKDIKWGVGIVSEKVIDKINILEATKLAMQKAIKGLGADFLLIDGNFTIYCACLPAGRRQKSIIKGDQKVVSISAASIIAKVTRDRIMKKTHKKYPQYGFDKHKGYGTAMHMKMIKKFGPCKIHRQTFYPVHPIK